jgi:glycogen operon protein
VEGPTDDPAILAVRDRVKRAMLATLIFSNGTPMLLGGDEFGRSQGGNNNAWCQDSEISWFDWETVEGDGELLGFARELIALRHAHPVFRRRQFLHGTDEEGSGLPDVWWFRPDGRRMTKTDWEDGGTRLLGMFLNGEEIVTPDVRGERIVDDSFVLLFNAGHEDAELTLPPRRFGAEWTCELRSDAGDCGGTFGPGAAVPLVSRSLMLLRRTAA